MILDASEDIASSLLGESWLDRCFTAVHWAQVAPKNDTKRDANNSDMGGEFSTGVRGPLTEQSELMG